MNAQSREPDNFHQIINDYPYSIPEAGQWLGYKATTIYSLLNKGKLSAIKLGNQTRIMGSEIRRFLNAAPAYKADDRSK